MTTTVRSRPSAGQAIRPTGMGRRTQKTAVQGGQRVTGFVVMTFILLSTVISLYDLRLLIVMLGR